MKIDAGKVDAGNDPPIIDEHNTGGSENAPDGAIAGARAASSTASSVASAEPNPKGQTS